MTRNIVETLDLILERAAYALQTRKDEVDIPALKELEGSMKQRIHNKGLDSNGERIGIKGKLAGKYSPGYEKRKRDGGIIAGRSFSGTGEANLYPINLQLHGDLLKGFTVGTSGGNSVLEFQDELSRVKAGRHEDNYNTEIYRPSESEMDDFKEVYLAGFEEVLRDALKPGL